MKRSKIEIIINSIRQNMGQRLSAEDLDYLNELDKAGSISHVNKNGRNVLQWYMSVCKEADTILVKLIIKAGIKLTHTDEDG